MSIYTPRGLKIRLPIDYAFALIARLYPKVTAFEVLQLTETLENLPSALFFIGSIVSLIFSLPFHQIFLVSFIAYTLGTLMNYLGFYSVPLSLFWSKVYGLLTGYGIFLLAIVICGLVFSSWQAILVVAFSRFMASILSWVLNIYRSRKVLKASGIVLTLSEQHFINAYRLMAQKHGVTMDIDIQPEETEEEFWMPSLEHLADSWPQIVKRFEF